MRSLPWLVISKWLLSILQKFFGLLLSSGIFFGFMEFHSSLYRSVFRQTFKVTSADFQSSISLSATLFSLMFCLIAIVRSFYTNFSLCLFNLLRLLNFEFSLCSGLEMSSGSKLLQFLISLSYSSTDSCQRLNIAFSGICFSKCLWWKDNSCDI